MPSRRSRHTSLIGLRRRIFPAAAVLVGGIVGSAGRIMVNGWLPADSGGFPLGVLVVNLVGSLLLGFYVARREMAVSRFWSLHLWAIGALGSFTTFSTFSLDVIRLLRVGRPAAALGYAGASVIGGLALALLGLRYGRYIR